MNQFCKQCIQRNPASGYCPKKGYEVDEDQAACACFNAVPPSRNLPNGQAMTMPKAPASGAPKEKTCRKCGRTLPVDQFARNVKSKDGYIGVCRSCLSKTISEARVNRNASAKKKDNAKQGGVNPSPAAPEPEACDPVPAPAPVSKIDTLRSISDEQMLKELKRRGYSGKIQKTIEYTI